MKTNLSAVAVAAVVASSSMATAAVYVVSPDPTMGDFPTIQAAIDAVVDGDEIELADGTFVGPGNRDLDFLGKAIIVRSQSREPATCVIDCQAGPGDPHRAFDLHSGEPPTAQVQWVTMAHGYEGNGAAIRCTEDSSPTITGCVLTGNHAYWDGGAFYCGAGSSAMVRECWFEGNTSDAGGGAASACFNYDEPATFSSCTFVGNAANYGGGLYI